VVRERGQEIDGGQIGGREPEEEEGKEHEAKEKREAGDGC